MISLNNGPDAPRGFFFVRRSIVGVLAATVALIPFIAEAEYEGPDCVSHRGHVIYQAYGYTHFVAIENGCDEAVTCHVHTSATESELRVQVAAGASEEVVTRRGSPASEFVVTLRCVAD